MGIGVSVGTAKMSSLVVDSNLDMGSYNIALNAGQTVDGMDVGKELVQGFIANDAEVTEGGGAYVTVKTLTVTKVFYGDLFISFETKHSTGAATAHARVYGNNVALGTVRDTQLTSYQAWGEVITFTTLTIGQTIQLRIYPDGGVGVASAQKFRIFGGVEGTIS